MPLLLPHAEETHARYAHLDWSSYTLYAVLCLCLLGCVRCWFCAAPACCLLRHFLVVGLQSLGELCNGIRAPPPCSLKTQPHPHPPTHALPPLPPTPNAEMVAFTVVSDM